MAQMHGDNAMAGNANNGNANNGGRHGNRWRMAAWSIVAILLLLPYVAMLFTDEMDWTMSDFIFAAVIVLGTGLTFELVTRKSSDTAYRAAVAVALGTAFLLIWVNAAVGIIGDEDNNANFIYLGVLLIGIIGAIVARLQPHGMALTLFAMAIALVLVAVVAIAAGWAPLLQTVGLTLFFGAPFTASALLFQKAARGEASQGAH
jgi:hypothetical protein